MMARSFILIFLFFGIVSNAQVQCIITTDKDSIEVGEPFNLIVNLYAPDTTQVSRLNFDNYEKIENMLYDSNFFEQYLDLKVLDNGDWPISDNGGQVAKSSLHWNKTNDGYALHHTLKMSFFNFGLGQLPNPIISSSTNVSYGNPPYLLIKPSDEAMEEKLAPNKDIIEEPTTFADVLPYFLGLLAFILLIGLGIYLSKKKSNTITEFTAPEPETIIIPAHVKALESLNELNNKQLWQRGEIKEYQSELTHVIRQYLEDRYDVNALEMTTNEILKSLSKKDFEAIYNEDLREILTVADLVKFAKATPEENIHQKFMDKSVDFVNNTKIVEQPDHD